MRRYEKMSNEELYGFLKHIFSGGCLDCPALSLRPVMETCGTCARRYLEQEIAVPRWKTVKSQSDMEFVMNEFADFCKCHSSAPHLCKQDCPYYESEEDCAHIWLSELVEVIE